MTRSTHSSKPNGHACALTVHDLAASVDAGGILAAPAAIPSAAGANPDAYAEAAAAGDHVTRPRKKGAAPRSHRKPQTDVTSKLAAPAKRKAEPPLMQEIDIPLPADPGAFVDEIHHEVDLWQQWINLLKSDDEKIRQRAIERLTNMKYKGVEPVEEVPRVVFDMPGPYDNTKPGS
jgi:hypothetical protein